ncbi:NAD(P)/FAD-dependent oxidoreductase [Aquabacterium sp.]|uniref:NAD(P)/FAD-dependent oxidoreductase n=1 Tax=Aquabacterium sp. TaxID=1872578 RepID=UPI0035B0D079
MQQFDVVIIGAGAAGLFCAGVAGQRGLSVLVIDHAAKVAEKIRISGGGRCNFTNRDVSAANYLSENTHFARSALAGYTPQDFLELVGRHGIAWHEKHRGQLFCDRSADDIIQMLLAECGVGGVTRWQPCKVEAVRQTNTDGGPGFEIDTDRGPVTSHQLVVATGGLCIPKIGASDFGHRLAAQFGLTVTPLKPALVPLTFDAGSWGPWAGLAGISMEVDVATPVEQGKTGKRRQASDAHFLEDLLFTHRGLSGPAILQISSYWEPGQPLTINLAPHIDLAQQLKDAKQGSRKQLSTAWSQALPDGVPQRLAQTWLEQAHLQQPSIRADASLAEMKDRDLDWLGSSANSWQITPNGTEGYAKAEVTRGGVSTQALSSQTMGSKTVQGLYFIGEVVDVTGWLGGYNFQWAWASAMACARALGKMTP